MTMDYETRDNLKFIAFLFPILGFMFWRLYVHYGFCDALAIFVFISLAINNFEKD